MTILRDKLAAAGIDPRERAILVRLIQAPAPAIAAVGVNGQDFFFQFPRKNASNSVKWALFNMPRSTFAGNTVYVSPEEVKKSPEVPRIAVVRNPIERIVSCWRHAIRKMGAQFLTRVGDHHVTQNCSFKQFIQLVAQCPDSHPNVNYHFRSQYTELVEDVGGTEPDYLLHAETLADDWRALCSGLGWTHVELEQLNETKNGTVPYPLIDSDTRELIRTRYVNDFRTFNYPR